MFAVVQSAFLCAVGGRQCNLKLC